MTQEDKELLLRDLSARLPYGVKYLGYSWKYDIKQKLGYIDTLKYIDKDGNIGTDHKRKITVEDIKPYLFPLSSITEEQSLELFELFGIDILDSTIEDYIKINEVTGITFFLQKGFDVETHLDKLIDWLLKNHFDFRGLIPKGLALDATGLNIY